MVKTAVAWCTLFLLLFVLPACDCDGGGSSGDDDYPADDDTSPDDDAGDSDQDDDCIACTVPSDCSALLGPDWICQNECCVITGNDDMDDDLVDDDAVDDDAIDDDSSWWDEELAPPPSDEIGVFVAPPPQGDDTHEGTMAEPVATIARGIELARYPSHKVVFISAGNYSESLSDVDTSLYGGYAHNTWIRDIDRHRSIIWGPAGETPVRIITLDEPRTIDIEGITIVSSGDLTDYSRALRIQGGDMTVRLRRNIIRSGNTSGYTAHSEAIYVMSALTALELVRNRVTSGNVVASVTAETHALWGKSPAVIVGNVFISGRAIGLERISNALVFTTPPSSHSYFANNICLAGTAQFGSVATLWGDNTLINNTFVIDRGENQTGLELEAGNYVLVNNIIQGSGGDQSAALAINDPAASAVTLINNDFWAAGTSRLMQVDTVIYGQAGDIDQCDWPSCEEASNSLDVNPALAALPLGHLAADSQCIDAGVDPASWWADERIYYDVDGELRPQGATWDIGADEWGE